MCRFRGMVVQAGIILCHFQKWGGGLKENVHGWLVYFSITWFATVNNTEDPTVVPNVCQYVVYILSSEG